MSEIKYASPEILWVYIYLQPERELRIEFPEPEQAKAYFDQIPTKKNGASLTDQYVDLKLPSTVQKLESNGQEGIVLCFDSHRAASDWKDAIFWSVSGRPDAVFVKLSWAPGSLEEELGIASSNSQDHSDNQNEPLQESARPSRQRDLIVLEQRAEKNSPPPASSASSATRRRTITLGTSHFHPPNRDYAPNDQAIDGPYRVRRERLDDDKNRVTAALRESERERERRQRERERRRRSRSRSRSGVEYSPPGRAEPSRHIYERSFDSSSSSSSPPAAARGSNRRSIERRPKRGWFRNFIG